jgi:hypothetical protein
MKKISGVGIKGYCAKETKMHKLFCYRNNMGVPPMDTVKVAEGHAGAKVLKVGKTGILVNFHGINFGKTLTEYGRLRAFASLGEVCYKESRLTPT